MAKRDLGDALSSTLDSETNRRFEIAARVLGSQPEPPAAPQPAPVSASRIRRASFGLLEEDHALVAQLTRELRMAGEDANKSVLVRAALRHFATLGEGERLAAVRAVEKLPRGRPTK